MFVLLHVKENLNIDDADWSMWSACSSSCVGGSKLRHRYHSCGLAALYAGSITAVKETETADCGEIGNFGPWSR